MNWTELPAEVLAAAIIAWSAAHWAWDGTARWRRAWKHRRARTRYYGAPLPRTLHTHLPVDYAAADPGTRARMAAEDTGLMNAIKGDDRDR